jgi:hypothetical protein
MTSSVKHPLLQYDTAALVSVDAARVIKAACGLAAAYDGVELGSTLGLSNHLIAVHGVHRLVSLAVKHDASHRTLPF